MLKISAEIRKEFGRKTEPLREKDIVPAVLYGPEIKTQSIELDLKEFNKVFSEAGESSLVSLSLEGKEFSVLIHQVQTDPMSGKIIHIDFYQPILTEEVEVEVPLEFEGEAGALKDLGGTLYKGFQEAKIKALPQDLIHEIKVNVEKLKTFDDVILVKDLEVPKGVKILKDPDEIVARVVPLEKVEEELEKPIEEKVEEVEKVEAERKEEPEPEEEK
ncbi:MAG: 50S ribosomal protein L25 [Candidatus Pacebacteria bacterium]|nr:50S ribosomal protein L25 [Candidatus Paceibacterota bacterium]